MRKRLTTILALLMVSLGLVASGTVAFAPPADAAFCRTLVRSYSVEYEPGASMNVNAHLYVCDYGSYETASNIIFTWSGGTSFIRKLYDGANDGNIQKRCGGSSTWVTIRNTENYYNGTVYALGANCTEPAYFKTDLTADVVWWFDSTVRHNWGAL